MSAEREALELALEAYLCREMPAGTVIGDPKWWAPKIAAAIKEALAQDVPEAGFGNMAQPEQEQVAIADCGEAGHDDGCCGNRECLPSFRITPPKRQPLTPGTIRNMYARHNDPVDFVRAVEKLHGVGG